MRIMRLLAIVAVVIVGIALMLQKGQAVHAQSAASGQQIGTINGQPIFAPKKDADATFAAKHDRLPTAGDQQEVAAIAAQATCDDLKSHVAQAARDSVERQFAISVSSDELAKAINDYTAGHDPAAELQKERRKWTTYNLAAAEVLDQHQDPEKVYQTLIAPLGESPLISHKVWVSNLAQWSKPGGRAALTKMVATSQNSTPETMKQGITKATEKFLMREKLDQAVDVQLAAEDPKFRADLEEYQKHIVKKNAFEGSGLAPSDYMTEKRQQFWQSRYAQQQVTLNDPTLADKCQLGSTMGVKVAGK